jgi:hypothetical protein
MENYNLLAIQKYGYLSSKLNAEQKVRPQFATGSGVLTDQVKCLNKSLRLAVSRSEGFRICPAGRTFDCPAMDRNEWSHARPGPLQTGERSLVTIWKYIYRIYSHNLRTFFPSLAAEKSGCVKYADFLLWRSWSGSRTVLQNLSLLICTTLYNYYSFFPSWNFNTSAH